MTNEETKRCVIEFKPEGYSIKEDGGMGLVINYTNKRWSIDYNIDTDAWVFDKYGDFLQKVIEGANIRADNDRDFIYLIVQNHLGVFVKDHYDYEDLLHEKGLDEKAKEQVIKYILEHTDEVR